MLGTLIQAHRRCSAEGGLLKLCELRPHLAKVFGEDRAAEATAMASRAPLDLRVNTLKSNRDKVLYPRAGFTKGDVIDYYLRAAPVLLPHLQGRPLTLKRYPDGVESQHFYEKQCPSHRPDWVATVSVPSRGRGHIDYCLANDAATLA